MRNIILIVILLFTINSAVAQIEVVKPGAIDSVRLDKNKPTVYTDYLCENDKDIYLKPRKNLINCQKKD